MNSNTNNNHSVKYFCFLETDGKNVQVSGAKRLMGVNQFKRFWRSVNSRDLARKLNTSKLVIK